jgi:DNA-binding CsgD family transcriptional regulator
LLDRCASLAEACRAIGCVPSADWCEVAARALLRTLPNAQRLAIVIARCDRAWRVESLEAAGVVEARAGAHGPELRLAIDQWVGRPAPLWPRDGENADAPYGAWSRVSDLADADAAALWREAGVGVLLAAASRVHAASSRTLIAIADMPERASASAPLDAKLLRVGATIAAQLGALAFGKGDEPIKWLTRREQEILDELKLGRSVREISENLHRSAHTIHDHVKALHRKLDASSRGELIARALGYAPLAHAEPKPPKA